MPRATQNRRRSTLGQIMAKGPHWRARYTRNGQNHTPGRTFSTFKLADDWLADEQRLIDRDEWTPPAQRRQDAEAAAYVDSLTLAEYAENWITNRRVRGRELRPRTAEHYRDIAARWFPPLDARPVAAIERAEVGTWYTTRPDNPTMRKHSYDLLRSIMASAVRDGLIERNPVEIPGASAKTTPARFELPTAEQVAALADAMPAEHRLAVLLAAWCGLRFGEVSALRRSDVVAEADAGMVIRVRRGVVRVQNTYQEGPTKSDAGQRDVVVPPHIAAEIRDHLKRFAQWGADGLLFPPTRPETGFLTQGQLAGHKAKLAKNGSVREAGSGYRGACESVGLVGVSFHKLRHFAGTNLAIAGATTRELMDFMGHSDLNVAMRYQHASQSRAEQLAARLSAIAGIETGQQTS